MEGLVVDLFAGGGGASEGLAMALGRDPDIAINHDAEALVMHKTNHPSTRHLLNDITRVLPLEATGGQPVAILHASPDCTHFSKAKGGKPKSQFIRDLAWVVIRWAEDARPTLITLENVEEFLTWGPLDSAGHPIKAQAGATFRAWVRRLRRLGYKVDWRLLRACDYGAPTTRRRLFVVARRDGRSIVWPKPTHGSPKSADVLAGKILPWRTAAECIDWSIPSQSIFERKKPLAENTQRRIAEGLRRYVLNAPEPFVVTYYGPKSAKDFRGQDLRRPLPTQTTENRFGLVSPVVVTNTTGHAPTDILHPMPTLTTGNQQMVAGAIVHPNHTASYYTPFRGQDIKEPLRAITKSPGFALASAFMTKFNTGSIGYACDEPVRTITAGGKQARPGTAVTQGLVTANMVKMRGTNIGAPVDTPLHTVSAQGQHHALLTACIAKHFGTSIGHPVSEPLHTVTGRPKLSLTSACMVKYYGNESGGVPLDSPMHTVTAKDRMGLVEAPMNDGGERYAQVVDWLRSWGVIGPEEEAEVVCDSVTYRINDICMRMLAPRELYTAQGFGDDYEIEHMRDGARLTKTAQVRMCGNSVPPQLVAALVSANGPHTWVQSVPASLPLMRLLPVASVQPSMGIRMCANG